MMSEEDDDYMSDNLLAKIDDARPGLLSRSQVRRNELEKKQLVKNDLNAAQNQSIKVIEETKRNEALAKSIIETDTSNKGLSMMKKMGFQVGQALGKEGASSTSGRIVEPIAIKLKSGREGLGGEEARKRKLREFEEKKSKHLRQREVADELSKKVFIRTKRQLFEFKRMRGRLRKAQNVCYQLDSSSSVTKPESMWYWPRRLLPKTESSEDEVSGGGGGEKEKVDAATAAVCDDGDEELDTVKDEDIDEESEEILNKRLETICNYLRTNYLYCIYCGTKFVDTNDFDKNCPGPNKDDHDDE